MVATRIQKGATDSCCNLPYQSLRSALIEANRKVTGATVKIIHIFPARHKLSDVDEAETLVQGAVLFYNRETCKTEGLE